MNNPLNSTLDSDKSSHTAESGSLVLDSTPSGRRNPKLENMRISLKNSLFNPEKVHSMPMFPISMNSIGNDENKGTPTSENLDRSHGTPTYKNSNMEKYRKLIKGNLFPQSSAKVINFLNENADDISLHDKRQNSTPSLVLTPLNMPNDDPNQDSLGFSSYIDKNFTPVGKVEESQHEDSISLDHGDHSHRSLNKGNISNTLHAHHIQSLDYLESPSRDSDIRSSIFLRDVESEIDEIKKDLEVENDPNIHFIRGNFYHNYVEGEILGEGTTGTVKKCIRMSDNVAVAVKIVHYRDDLEVLTLIVKEFKNHRRLNHKTIIKVYDLYVDYFKKKIYTVMELAECREMFAVLKDLGHYSEAVASGIFKQILTGINYLHLNGVCHRDLKPNNILVSEDGKIVKITDFNVSKFVEDKIKKFSFLSKENYKMWTYTGTIAFTAPEVFDESEYTECVDMWSAGVVLYTMLCGYQPFQAEYVQDLIEKIKAGKYEFSADPWVNISKQAKNLVKRCLDVNYKTRCSPSEALMHPWIANCGKISNTNIPRTVAYFNRFYRKNTLKRDKYPSKPFKSGKSSTICHPHSTKACDKCVSKGFDFSIEPENTPEFAPEEHQSNESQQSVDNLQPKRGKTGPGVENVFRPNFLLKIEKSFSFSFLEDPKYYGVREGVNHDKHLENKEKNEEDESDEDEQGGNSNLERIYKQNIKPSANNAIMGENLNKDKSSERLSDITNNEKLKEKQENDEEKSDSNEGENRKVVIKKEGKENENESRLDKKKEKIWLEKNNLYNEPLQMQE